MIYMLTNYIKIALRNLRKHKGYTFLHISGLAIGMAVFLLAALYVRFERSYENFIPGAENIYRVKLEQYLNNELTIASAENFPGVGPALQQELPEVLGNARLYNLGYKNNVIITNTEAKPEPIAFKHRRFLYADSAFLTLMGYPMVAGDAAIALAEPLTAVLSEDHARRYFGAEDPISKSLLMQDDDFNRQYENERRFGKLATVFAILAIFIGCLGLFGLLGYTIAQRTKEIGIRKVLGSTTSGIVALLSKDILKLVGLAILLALPLGWCVMNQWLSNFAYRIDMQWWMFAVAGTVAVAGAFLAVGFQSVKAALGNPVKSLRSE